MQPESDAAQQIVNMTVHGGIEVAEHALKLAGLTAKQLAALVLALLKDNHKLKGKTNMNRLLRADKPLAVFPIPKDKQAEFAMNLKSHGVLFSAVRHIGVEKGMVDVVVWEDRAPKVNNILEAMGYNKPQKEEAPKNGPARVPSGGRSSGRGFGLLQQAIGRMNNGMAKPVEGKALESLPKELLIQFVAALAGENRQHDAAPPLAHLFDGKPFETHVVSAKAAEAIQPKADMLGTPVFFLPSEKEGRSILLAKQEDAAIVNKLFENAGYSAPMKGAPEAAPQEKAPAPAQTATEPKRRSRAPKDAEPQKSVKAQIEGIKAGQKAAQGKAKPKAPKAKAAGAR